MIFEVWPNGGSPEDGMTILNAVDAEDAAEKYGERADYESAGYSIVGGSPEIVSVRAIDSDEVEVFTVSGEVVNTYSASRINQ